MTTVRAMLAALLVVTLLSSSCSSPSDRTPAGVTAEKGGSGETISSRCSPGSPAWTIPCELRDDLPPGELLRSPELDRAFSTTFSTQVWISPESDQVVLTATGQ